MKYRKNGLTFHVDGDVGERGLGPVVIGGAADVDLAEVLLGEHVDLHGVVDLGLGRGERVVHHVAIRGVPCQTRDRFAFKNIVVYFSVRPFENKNII